MSEAKRILLAEDDPAGVELTLAALRELHLADEVEVACDGEEALDYLYRRGRWAHRALGNPAVILLDLKMPKVGGLEVLRQLRSDEALRLIPVVVMTSSNQARDIADSYRLGADSFVVKPVHTDDFMRVVREVGIFWGTINEPPPGSVARELRGSRGRAP